MIVGVLDMMLLINYQFKEGCRWLSVDITILSLLIIGAERMVA
ncbi:hypothetical protein [Aminipila sp.]|nr:hypothetical protein [Aminipila sp.]